MTEQEKINYNLMLSALTHISSGYSTPEELREEADSEYGLDYEEALEMAYENIQSTAASIIKGIKKLD